MLYNAGSWQWCWQLLQMNCGLAICLPLAELVLRVLLLFESRLRWFGHVERKEDNDWAERCITWEVEGIGQREDARKRPGGIVLRMI